MKTYFSSNGYHCPSTYNPADFLIGVLAKTDKAKIESVAHKLCDAFEASRFNQLVEIENNFTIDEEVMLDVKKPFWMFTIFWLIHRNLLVVARDPTIQKIRIIQKIVSFFFCFVFLETINSNFVADVGNCCDGRALFLWNNWFDAIWNTISARSIVYTYFRKYIFSNVFSIGIISSTIFTFHA